MESKLVHDHGRIQPFWLRIPSFFAYPSQKPVLMVMIGFSVLQVFTYLPGIDWIVALLLWLAAYKYSYEVLVHTAEGHLDPPESRYMAGTDSMGLRQFFLVIGMMLMVQGAWWFTESMIISGIFALFLLLAFPAAIITLGMTRSLFAALNPITWISLIARIGGPYFLVFLFLFFMVSSMGALEAFLEPDSFLFYTLMRPLFYFIDFYFMVAMFHLMGYMIYQYHEELGVEVTATHQRPADRAAAPDAPLITQSKDLVQEGKLAEAVDLVGGQLRGHGGTPELHDHYRKLLLLKKDKRALLEHANQYLPILLESVENFRSNYPALFVAFPGDEEQFGGCLAAGRGFVHVNAAGDVEPCPFAPYSDVNLRRTSLREALASPLLGEIGRNHDKLVETRGGCALWANREWVQSLLADGKLGEGP